MRYMNIFVGALSVLALMSCSDDPSDKARPDIDMQLIVTCPAIDNPDISVSQPVASSIGLYSRDIEGNVGGFLRNVQATFNGRKWYFNGREQLILSEDSLTVFGYSPYDPSVIEPISVPIKTGTVDYLYGSHRLAARGYVCRSQPVVELSMQHALSKLRMDLRPILNAGRRVSRMVIKPEESDIKPIGTAFLDIQTGEINGQKALTGEIEAKLEKESAYIYMIPCECHLLSIGIEVEGKMMWTIIQLSDLTAGKQYNFWLDIDVSREALVTGNMTIEEWEVGSDTELGNVDL